MHVGELKDGERARITGFDAAASALEAKLREIGFCEGDVIEVLMRGPFGQPLAVRLNRRMIAMRKREAAAVLVELAF